MKKNFLFGLLALMLAGAGFGGISMAESVNFQMSVNKDVNSTPITFPVVLNEDGDGLNLAETKAALVQANMAVGDLYTALANPATTQEALDAAAKVVEVEGQKLLFFNDGTKIGVFTEEKEGGIFSSRDMFITSSASTKDYTADTLAVDLDNKVDPFNVSAGTIDKYHEIEKEGDVIGYTFHIDSGKWFYAPKREITTVNFQMSVNKDVNSTPITFPVVLNEDGDGLNLQDTIIALNQANMAVGDLYAALTNPATTQEALDAAAKVVEVEGQKLLFFNDGSKIGVFTQELDGGIFSSRDMFITSSSTTKNYTENPVAYDLENKVDPFEVSDETVDKYHEISKDGDVIGYTLHTVDNKWFYAPIRELNTVEFQMSTNKDDANGALTFPVVLNENGNGLVLLDTIIALNQAQKNEGALYTALTASTTTQQKLDEAAKVVEVEGQKLLFFQQPIDNQGHYKIGVFNEKLESDGPFSDRTKFIGGTSYDSENPTITFDSDSKTDPFTVSSWDIKTYNEIQKDSKIVGYTIYVENDGNNGWFYAPKTYKVTFHDPDGKNEDAVISKGYGSEITAPTWTKNGYTLSWDKTVTTMPAEDTTINAIWTAKQSGGSYSGGGGSSRSSSKTTTTDDTKKAEDTTTKDETKVDETKTDETKNDTDNEGSDGNKNPTEFSQEFIDAYNFAYKNGITTKESIEEADMFEPLTRVAMAKMLSQYAINVLGKEPDTTKVVPTFSDVDAKLDADYNNGITLAYQLGIMGIGINKYRPFDLVTRAEFGTALSRMLFGLEDGEGNEWYSTHLAKLMEEKIITNNNPNLQELRGYVMIMLMRSAQ